MEEINQPDLPKGIVYEIVCNITNERYIGSSFQNIETRIAKHKCPNNKTVSKQIIERGDYTYNILYEGFFERDEDLRKIEQQYIDNNTCINKKAAYLSIEQITEYFKKYQKQYKDKNRDKHKEYMKKYNQRKKIVINIETANIIKTQKNVSVNCSCGGKFIKYNKKQHFATKKHKKYEASLSEEIETSTEN